MQQQIYLNSKQEEFFRSEKPYKMFLAGRGTGKSTVEGLEQYEAMAQMPRGRGFFAACTYANILNVELPAQTKLWESLGLIEGEDYVVGKKPPASFARCLDEPRKYENVISWANGHRIILFSMDRPDLNRGGSFHHGALGEAALVPHDSVTRVLLPSIRGGVKDFASKRRGQFRAYTTIPWKPSGYWVLDYEEKAKNPKGMHHFTESSAVENLEILGHDYLERMQAEMGYLEYLVEVLNQRVKKAQDAFYHKFEPDKHTYTPRHQYGESDNGIILAGQSDQHYKPDGLMEISFDFSGWFNCATIWQEGTHNDGARRHKCEYCLHQFFVKTEEGKVGELVDKICQHYGSHKTKLVRLWGEPRGHDHKPDTPQTLFQQIQTRFQRNGWGAEIKVQNIQVKSHKERGQLMNDALAEQTGLPMLRFNDHTCKDVVIAMQVTGTKEDGSKDKSKEKDRLFPQEHAPHFTDTVDYYYTQKYGAALSRQRIALSAGAM